MIMQRKEHFKMKKIAILLILATLHSLISADSIQAPDKAPEKIRDQLNNMYQKMHKNLLPLLTITMKAGILVSVACATNPVRATLIEINSFKGLSTSKSQKFVSNPERSGFALTYTSDGSLGRMERYLNRAVLFLTSAAVFTIADAYVTYKFGKQIEHAKKESGS